MSKKTLNQTNLEALGAPQLAALLMEVSQGSADIKRRLRLELAHNLGPAELAHDVRKRLVSLRKSTSFIGWRKRKALIKDLTTQAAMIADKIAPDAPALAFDLLWQFIELAPSIYRRVDDSRGDVGDVFRAARALFGDLGPRADLDPDTLADKVWSAVRDNDYGQWDGIIALTAPALGPDGLARLQDHVQTFAEAPTEAAGPDDHAAILFLRELRGGDRAAQDRKTRFVRRCLQDIATAQGDRQAYIAQYSDADLQRADVAAEVAGLYLADGQAERALDALTGASRDARPVAQAAWDAAYLDALDALGRAQDAQTHRWTCFTETLDPAYLRAYLKQLPDFDDVEAEHDAKAHVLGYPDLSAALAFCLDWPDLVTAAQLIEQRAGEIDGDHYGLLTTAAEALRLRHPLAAVLVWRAMIDDALGRGRATRYGYAAEHLAECTALDPEITDYGAVPNHADYMQALEAEHGRKAAFWAKLR